MQEKEKAVPNGGWSCHNNFSCSSLSCLNSGGMSVPGMFFNLFGLGFEPRWANWDLPCFVQSLPAVQWGQSSL